MYGLAAYAIESVCAADLSCREYFGKTWEGGMKKIFRTLEMDSTVFSEDIILNRKVYENTDKLARSHLKWVFKYWELLTISYSL